MKMNQYGFRTGFSQVRQKDVKQIRHKIMSALGLKTRMSWYTRLNGTVEPKISEAKAIEEIFHEYGITDVWDN